MLCQRCGSVAIADFGDKVLATNALWPVVTGALVLSFVSTYVFYEAGQHLTLRDYGSHSELLIGKVPLLSSARLDTERQFGRLALKKSSRSGITRIVVGGLGFGATLQQVLAVSRSDTQVIVVEKLATVIDLVRGRLRHIAPGVLDDKRVTLVRDDVVSVIERERGLDVILLDVDNGPNWASFRSNSRLYSSNGLRMAFRALGKKGRLAVWSGYPADAFLKRLRRAGFESSKVALYERGKLQARAYVGIKP